MLPKIIWKTPHSSAKLNVVFFYICLSVHIMYIIHNKATFMVNEIINPIIRKSRNSTIMTTSSLSKESRFRGNTHTCLILTFYVNYYTIFFYKFQYQNTISSQKLLYIFQTTKFIIVVYQLFFSVNSLQILFSLAYTQ